MTGADQTELRYFSKNKLQLFTEELDSFWLDLQADSALRQKIIAAGFDLTQVMALPRNSITISKEDKAGLDPATTAIIVAFSPVAAKIAKDLWDRVILPRIERRWGKGSVRTNP